MAMRLERVGGAGGRDHLEVPNESDYDLTSAISISLWMLHDGLWQTNYEVLIAKGDSAWRLSNDRADRWLHWATSGTSPFLLAGSTAVDDGAWHHVVVTFLSGSPGRKYIYLDGAVEASDASVTGSIDLNDYDVFIGENEEKTGRQYHGWLHDVRVYNRELSLAEAQAIFRQRGGDGVRDGLLSRWIGNQGYPTQVISSVYDAGSLENDASAVDTPSWAESPYGSRRRRAA